MIEKTIDQAEKWYNRNIFPLIPILKIKKADKYNTSSISFKWLVFTFWSLDNPHFELSIVADTHWGIGAIGILPYLRWVVTIPCPRSIGRWIDNKFSRKIKGDIY